MVKIPLNGNPELRSIYESKKGRTIDSDEEFHEFIENNPAPDGQVWSRTPFGAEPGKWRVYLKKESTLPSEGSGLEDRVQELLEEWGYSDRFERHYSYPRSGHLDFADPVNKVALEPGAVYYHTPEDFDGEAKENIGQRPEEVYSPVTARDVAKQDWLDRNGWDVLWITQSAVDEMPCKIRSILFSFYAPKRLE